MWNVFSALASALSTLDAGLSMSERFSEKNKKLIPKFLYRNDYYFEEINKKVFIKTNGDGVVVCSCDLYVINPEKVEHFIRSFDISDAPKSTRFPSLKSMCKKKKAFFTDCGFWYSSENDIISSVEEYCNDDFTQDEKKRIAEGRLLGVRFFIDKSKLESKHKYRILYGYSIPRLYPIKNGKHDRAEYKKSTYDYTSAISMKRMAKKLRLAIYLEKGICIEVPPYAKAVKAVCNQTTPSSVCQVRDNILYTKYLYELKRPEKYSQVQIKWKLK